MVPGTIAKRLLNIGNIVGKIDFRHDDGLKVMKEYDNNDDSVFFIDPHLYCWREKSREEAVQSL